MPAASFLLALCFPILRSPGGRFCTNYCKSSLWGSYFPSNCHRASTRSSVVGSGAGREKRSSRVTSSRILRPRRGSMWGGRLDAPRAPGRWKYLNLDDPCFAGTSGGIRALEIQMNYARSISGFLIFYYVFAPNGFLI